MEAQRWSRVEELFHTALEQPRETRMQFVRDACQDDSQLRVEVESLLRNAPEDDSFLRNLPLAKAALSVGQKLGNFEILSALGSGGMGEVYRARDLRLKREVAIKVLPRSFANDAERLARFEREARAASALNHPNIVCVYDIGRQESTAWIVSELVDGQSLREALEKGPLPMRRAMDIAIQIANGLAAAHAAGLVHRDLKPENIMLTREGRVKILDLGLARHQVSAAAAASAGGTITEPGMISGTPGYMSPEQISGRGVDPRSDLFSLGVVAYEMLAGKRPFSGDTSISAMNAVLSDEPAELPATVPFPIAKLLRHCMEKQPEQRLQSAADFSFTLQVLCTPEAPQVAKQKKRGWVAWPLIATATLLALFGAFSVRRQATKSQAPVLQGTLRRLTWDSGITTDGAISPDGKLVAYSSNRANQNRLDIYVQQIDSGGVLRLTDGPADDYDPTFSSDGSQVAFRSERGTGGIYQVSALGGEARLLVPGADHPRFSPDGRYLMYLQGANNGGSYATLFIQDVLGGSRVQVSRGCEFVWPGVAWSPDSLHVLFWGSCGGNWSARLGSIDGNAPRAIKGSDAFLPSHGVSYMDAWLANPSRVLACLWGRDASFEAALPIAPDGTFTGQVQRLTFGPATTSHGSASASGRMVLSTYEETSNIWRLSINAAGHAVGGPMQITAGLTPSVSPSLSRDGKKVAFVTRESLVGSIHMIDLRTSSQRTLVRDPDIVTPPFFNPAGDWIAYNGSGFKLRMVATSGGLAQFLPSEGFFTDWSERDDLLSLDVDGQHSVNVVERSTSKPFPFLSDSQSILDQAHFSHDAQWVTFSSVKDGRSRIYVVPFRKALISKSQWIPATDGLHWDDKPHFSSDGKAVFFTSDRDGYQCLWAQPLTSDMHPNPSRNSFAVFHFHSSKRLLRAHFRNQLELGVAPGIIVFNQAERTGNLWLLDPP